jgi:ribosomal 50S subunit-recycling heat shock protein
MRLDLFLKRSGIIKRRTIAQELISKGRIKRDGKAMKSAYEVKTGDEYEIHLGNRLLRIRVSDLAGTQPSYEVVSQIKIPVFDNSSQPKDVH